MRFFTALTMATAAVAIPTFERAPMPEENSIEARGSSTSTKSQFRATPILGCILPPQASNIVNTFNYLLANPQAPNFAATANALFSNDFTDTSDSINQLAGIPEGSTTFANKQDFINMSSQQPPLILQTLDIFWSCNAISWRWISQKGAGDDHEPVKGIDNFYITPFGQVKQVFAEFNSGAWLADLGYPECSATSTATAAASTS